MASCYNYVATGHKPTNVSCVSTAHFTSADHLNLIIAKCNRIEIHKVGEEGLSPMFDFALYGKISALEVFRPEGEVMDWLFVLTERFQFCVLAHDANSGEIVTKAMGTVKDPIGRPSESPVCTFDPFNGVFGLHLYEGSLKIIHVEKNGTLQDAFNVRLEELKILDLIFLPGMLSPTLAVLYEDHKESRHLKTYEVNIRDNILCPGPWKQSNVFGGASILIPVPRSLGGLIVLGRQSIVYHSGRDVKTMPISPTTFLAWAPIDVDGARWLLADNAGGLHILVLDHHDSEVRRIVIDLLGQASIASALCYLDNAVVFLGSSFGDSQLLKLAATAAEGGSYVSIIESYVNLGPIADFIVVDLERQGRGHIVTCSGAFKDGSLRVIRSGIGIHEYTTIDMPGLKAMWPLRSSFGSKFDSYLVQTFSGETRVLSMMGDEMEEIDLPGIASGRSILWMNMVGDVLLQVTETSVRLISCGNLQMLFNWAPLQNSRISGAVADSRQLVIAIGKDLIYFTISGTVLEEVASITLAYEIACLSFSRDGSFLAVSLWTDISLFLLRIPTLEVVTRRPLGGETQARSVLLSLIEGRSCLLVGLGDGQLVAFWVDTALNLTEVKRIFLGTLPVSLCEFVSAGSICVVAATDRPTVIYGSHGKILFSSLNVQDVIFSCPFNSEAFPNSLCLVSESTLTIGSVDEIQKLHVRSIPLGEQPRRIVHHELGNLFCVGTVAFCEDRGGTETETCFVRFFDDQTFEPVWSQQLDPLEYVCSIERVPLVAFSDSTLVSHLEEASDPTMCEKLQEVYLVIGTAYASDDEPEPSQGRILVFSVITAWRSGDFTIAAHLSDEPQKRRIVLVSEKRINGAVYSLNAFNGKLLAGINSKVQLFRWVVKNSSEKAPELVSECCHHGHVLALHIKSKGEFVVVGDLMKSISLLLYKPLLSTLDEIARDFSTNWMTALEMWTPDLYIGAENELNIFCLAQNSGAATEEERARLESVAEFHLGDFVNKFCVGSLVMQPSGDLSSGGNSPSPASSMLFATVGGLIGVILRLDSDCFHFFHCLERALAKVVKGIGGFKHSDWRSLQTDRKTCPSRNFIDGDLIESFMDLPRSKMDSVCISMNQYLASESSYCGGSNSVNSILRHPITVDEIVRRVEDMTLLH